MFVCFCGFACVLWWWNRAVEMLWKCVLKEKMTCILVLRFGLCCMWFWYLWLACRSFSMIDDKFRMCSVWFDGCPKNSWDPFDARISWNRALWIGFPELETDRPYLFVNFMEFVVVQIWGFHMKVVQYILIYLYQLGDMIGTKAYSFTVSDLASVVGTVTWLASWIFIKFSSSILDLLPS